MRTGKREKLGPERCRSVERLFEETKLKRQARTEAGNAICSGCGAVGMHKHWFFDGWASNRLANDPLTRYVNCPGCKRLADQHYEGEVILQSDALIDNKDMILSLIHHEAARSYLRNPLSRLALIEDQGNIMRIVTTTCGLAERIGKSVHRAFKGDLEIKPSPGEKFVIVKWAQ